MDTDVKTEFVRRQQYPLSIECKVKRSHPIPKFAWKFRLGANKKGAWRPIPLQLKSSISRKGPSTSVFNISKRIRLPPSGVAFRCEASNEEGEGVQKFKVFQVI